MPDHGEIQRIADDDPIDSEWGNLRRTSGERPQQIFVQPPGFPDAALRPEVQNVLEALRSGTAVGSVQRRLVELALAFSIRPEDIPDGLLLRRERLTLFWIAKSPYYPMSSPREAMELIRTATWVGTKPTPAQRSVRARELWMILEPSLR